MIKSNCIALYSEPTHINKAIMKLEAHDRGKAPGLSNKSLLHDISDYDFSLGTSSAVITGAELQGRSGYYVEEEERKEERGHCIL